MRNRLGWLFCLQVMLDHIERLTVLARVVERQGYDRVLVLGMGGSSLWPEVIGRHLRGRRGLPVRIADSTHPHAVAEALAWSKAGKPLFVVATKSGGTVETLSLYRALRLQFNDGQHFVAITDPGSGLEKDLIFVEHECPDRNAHVHIAVKTEITEASAVGAPSLRFKLIDDLHGADFGSA